MAISSGINTFMLSEGGGSDGLGFAIPVSIVKFDYENLRRSGHVRRVAFGAKEQNITLILAAGLDLPRNWGVILSNVAAGGFAQVAGIEVGDIVTRIDNHTIDGLPAFVEALYLHPIDQAMTVAVLRGEREFSVTVPVSVYHDETEDLTDVPNVQRTLIPKLGMFVTDVNDSVKHLMHHDDVSSGVVVIPQPAGPNAPNTGVQTGDMIRSVNRTPVRSVSQLQTMARQFKSGDAVVLQIEREGKLQYLAFEMD